MNKLRTIQESYKNKEIRNFYQDARKTIEAQQKTATYLREKTGELAGKVEEKLKRWVEYVDEVLNTDSYEEQVEDLEPQENND
jgi:ribosome recycling factor